MVGFVEQQWVWTLDSVIEAQEEKKEKSVEFARQCEESNVGLHLQSGVADSGATNALTNQVCAEYLSKASGRAIMSWPKPRHIQFGNATRETSVTYIYGGDFLGNIAIIPSAPCTLIGIWDIIRSNCSVHFRADSVQVLFQWRDGETMREDVVYSGGVCIDKRMWHMDVVALMNLRRPSVAQTKLDRHSDAAVPATASAYAAKRKERLSSDTVRAIRLFHRRLNHQASPQHIAAAMRDMVWINVPKGFQAADVAAVFAKYPCLACKLSHMKRLPMALGSGIAPAYVGERVSVDGMPVSVQSVDGFVGYFHFRDQYSGFEHAHFYKLKTEFLDAVRELVSIMSPHGHKIRQLQFDAGSVEMSDASTAELRSMGIDPRPAVPKRQNQNTVERSAQTRAYAVAASMMDQTTLGKQFWSWAVRSAMDAHNSSYIVDGIAAITHVTGYTVDFDKDLKFPFGTPLVVHDHQKDSFRFAPTGVHGVAVRSTLNGNGGTWVHIPSHNRGKPMVRYDVRELGVQMVPASEAARTEAMRLLEATPGVTTFESGGSGEYSFPDLPVHQDDKTEEAATTSIPKPRSTDPVAIHTRARSRAEQLVCRAVDSSDQDDIISLVLCGFLATAQEYGIAKEDLVDSFDITRERVDESFAFLAMPKRQPSEEEFARMSLQEECEFEHQFQEERQSQATLDRAHAAFNTKRTEKNPTVTQAMKTEEGKMRWGKAIQAEYDQLVAKGVGVEVSREDIPRGAEILPSKIDLKAQHNPDGTFKKDKARMCVMSNLSKRSPYVNTFAATGNETTLKLLFQIAVILGWLIYGIDFVGAFLGARLPAGMHVYMRLPHYFDVNGKERYWKLVMAMYGLRESPAIFTDDVRTRLVAAGWKCLISDRAVYMKINSHGDIGILFTHSDDERLFCSHHRVSVELIATLTEAYNITLGTNESFVGYRELRLPDGSIHLSMPAKVDTLCADLKNGDEEDTPMAINCKEDSENETPMASPTQISDFRSKLGLALFIEKVMPQIQPACQLLAQQVNNLQTFWLRHMRRLRGYIKSVRSRGIVFTPGVIRDRSAIVPVFQCDAAFDVFSGSRSNGALMATIGNHDTAAFVAKTFILPNVPTSSCEAEIVTGAAAVKEIIYVRGFLEEITFKQLEPTVCYIDNLSMLQMSSEFAGRLKRVKHILRLLNFMVHHTKAGVVKWVHKPTKELTVDVLTKVHGPSTFHQFTNKLIGPEVKSASST